MTRIILTAALVCALGTLPSSARQKHTSAPPSNRILLGQTTGAVVSFVRFHLGEWGIEVSGKGDVWMRQEKPAQIEMFRSDEDSSDLAAGYESVQREATGIVAKATVADENGAVFRFIDRWKIAEDALILSRTVTVKRGEENAGFYSVIRLSTLRTVSWPDLEYLAPGVLYGDPSHAGDSAPGGTLNYRAQRFEIREDWLSAPLFAMSFRDGRWAAVMDRSPAGDTTWEETTAPATKPVIDSRIRFGAVGVHQIPDGGVDLGFWFPGTTSEFSRGIRSPSVPLVRRRYHPVTSGFSHTYQVGFRFGKSDSFPGMERDVWRWAWKTLNPPVTRLNLAVVRHTLTDHLEAHVISVDDRAGVPFLFDAVTGKPGSHRTPIFTGPSGPTSPPSYPEEETQGQKASLAAWARSVGVDLDPSMSELWRWPKVNMGFVSKGIEAADELLREGDRDPSARGKQMRQSGLAIIESFIRLVPMSPPAAAGFNLETGKPDSEPAGIFFLRAPSEGMHTLMNAYLREKREGRDHADWLHWCQQLADWLLTQQREDGSFPRSWKNGTGAVNEESGTSSYDPVPLLVSLSKVTGNQRYFDAAVRAGEYVWDNYGKHGVFVGGTTDNPNIVDKEAGMLSLEAFLALYEATRAPKWLERAEAAGNYTESWIWIWNVPMPIGADDAQLQWKRGVSTVGVQGISARGPGGVDEYLDWAVPEFAELYKETRDEHYLDVARILLFDTKNMLALPGRTYDLDGPGWQQENWGMGPGRRGFGSHRSWLPWISVNHLHSITGLEEFDPALYQRLTRQN
ncbi:MAG TPA: hypothetical protein VJV22_10670 [Acidobacteriaceae bacterium]|nr:hypothetical protein [Acidobacteriaceae bacterium]